MESGRNRRDTRYTKPLVTTTSDPIGTLRCMTETASIPATRSSTPTPPDAASGVGSGENLEWCGVAQSTIPSTPRGDTGKVCGKCAELLPLSSFHRLASSRDGRQYQCKACIKAYQQASPTFHANARENARAQAKRRPEQVAAKRKVAAAVKRGDLVRQPCELCAATEHIDAHHHRGYDFPLDVQWLCRSCHIRLEPRRGAAA